MSDNLRKKINQYRSAAELKLEEATKALDNEEFEVATQLREEANTLVEKAQNIKAQIESIDAAKGLELPEVSQPDPEPVQKSDPVRVPMVDDVDNSEPVEKATNPVYVLRYGDTDGATKAVIKDLYGTSYQQDRMDQQNAFNKFIRYGERRLTAREESLLRKMILLPQNVRQDVVKGMDVATMKATLQEMVNDLGGYLVPEDYRAEIISRMMGLTAVRPRARLVTTNRDAVEWPKLEGGGAQYTSAVRVTWVDEIPSSATVAETNPTFGMLRVPVYTAMARTDVSRNQLEDAAFDMVSLIFDLFAEAFAIDEDNQFLTGRGGGTPLGILGGGTALEPAPDTGIATVNSGAAGALTADGLYNLAYGLHSQYRANAVLLGARATHRDVRKLKDGNSRYLWEDSMKAGEPPTLLGYPFLETESMPAIAANAHPIVFGDLRGYLIVDRVGMSVERVTDSTTVGTNKVALFARRRLGGQVIEPWRFQAHKVSA